MKMTRMIALAIPIAFLLMSFARPAAAMKPEVTVETGHEEGTYWNCGSFQIAGQWDYEERYVTEFDNNGNPVTFVWDRHIDGTVWNTVSGLTVRANTDSHYALDLATGVWKAAGHFWHWTIPGRGVVLIEGGHDLIYPDHTDYHGTPHYFEIAAESGIGGEQLVCSLLA